jgi:steroid 5-alpha reductase family enzyme
MIYALAYGFAALLFFMSALFVVSLIRRDNGTADIGYGIAYIVLVATVALTAHSVSGYALLLCGLAAVWALRLAVRIGRKNIGKPEDFRYKQWRDSWGETFVVRSFLQVYVLQGLVVFGVALPLTLSLAYPSEGVSIPLFAFGVLLWCAGFFFEAVGDYQLDQFIKKPGNKGKIMTEGLWRYSRHPNYFGESTMWWGLAIAASSLTTLPALVFFSPLLITYLLLFVSGIPMLEKRWEGNAEWEAYKARTSAFIPLLPK